VLKAEFYSLPTNLYKNQLYLLEPHSESIQIGSAFTRINTEGKSMIMKLGPEHMLLLHFAIHKQTLISIHDFSPNDFNLTTINLNQDNLTI